MLIHEIRRLCDQAEIALPPDMRDSHRIPISQHEALLPAPVFASNSTSSGVRDKVILPKNPARVEDQLPPHEETSQKRGRHCGDINSTRSFTSNGSGCRGTKTVRQRPATKPRPLLVRRVAERRLNEAVLMLAHKRTNGAASIQNINTNIKVRPARIGRVAKPTVSRGLDAQHTPKRKLNPVTYSISGLFLPDYINKAANRIAKRLARTCLKLRVNKQTVEGRLTDQEACTFVEWLFHEFISCARDRVRILCENADAYQTNNSLACAARVEISSQAYTRTPISELHHVHTQDLPGSVKRCLRVMKLVEVWSDLMRPSLQAVSHGRQPYISHGSATLRTPYVCQDIGGIRESVGVGEPLLSWLCRSYSIPENHLEKYREEAEAVFLFRKTWGYGAIFFLLYDDDL